MVSERESPRQHISKQNIFPITTGSENMLLTSFLRSDNQKGKEFHTFLTFPVRAVSEDDQKVLLDGT